MWASGAILLVVLGCGRIAFDPVETGAPHCFNAIRDADETAIDCGGSCTLACRGETCSSDPECVTGRCTDGLCELADGPPGWLPGPALTTGRAYVRAASDSAGTIFAVAGTTTLSGGGAPGALATSESLAAGAQSWQPFPPLSTPRHRHAAAVVDDVLYVFGGRDQNNVLLASAERFASTWGPRMSAPSAHAGIDATAGADHRIYFSDLDMLLIYAPQSDSWTSISPALPARDSSAVVRGSDDRIYVIAGVATGTSVAAVTALDTATLTWTTVASLATPRAFPAALAAPDGRIYAIGGSDTGVTATVETYTPGIDRWTQGAPLAHVRFGLGAAVGPDGRLYAINGADDMNTVLSSVEVYGPVLALLPATASPGDTVSVSATNFAASAAFGVRLGDTLVATGTTDANGAATVTFVVPPLAAATYDVIAVDQRSQYPVRQPLRIP